MNIVEENSLAVRAWLDAQNAAFDGGWPKSLFQHGRRNRHGTPLRRGEAQRDRAHSDGEEQHRGPAPSQESKGRRSGQPRATDPHGRFSRQGKIDGGAGANTNRQP